jgi:hypothetical protein
MNHAELAQALLDCVRAQQFGATPDRLRGGAPLTHFPSIDLAVAAFVPGRPPVWANVLFSREHPDGLVAAIDAAGGPVRNVRFLADQRDPQLESVAWLPHSDWRRLRWQTLAGHGPHRAVAPYPASLLKLMVAVGVARLADSGAIRWGQALSHQHDRRPIEAWAFDMIAQSCNTATSALVALLHRWGLIRRDRQGERHNALHTLFAAFGLPTLRLADTRPDGGWRNADGAGVGHIHMTAWDTLRLLWLLDDGAPPAPWLAGRSAPLIGADSRQRLRGWLDAQGLHAVLSSGLLAGVPGQVPGLDAALPPQWLRADGTAQVAGRRYPAAAPRPAAALRFAHKTGNTENYVSNAGIVRGVAPFKRHYLIALLTNLGSRYATHPLAATNGRLPALGAAIDARLAGWMEAAP